MDIITKGELYQNVMETFNLASENIKMDRNVYERLAKPKRSIIVAVPVRMDDYSVKVFSGYRVQHSQTLGPCKGGIRYHPDVTLSETAGLALLMTFKNSLLNLPLGGAKGGVAVDPTQLSRTEKQNLTRRYASELSLFIGPDRDIPAPDVGTDPQTMAWIMDTYSQEAGYAVSGVVTGKPLEIGGSKGRVGATGLGVIYCLEEAVHKTNRKFDKDLTIAIQGFGNVGSNAAFSAYERGARVVAVSDVRGGIYNKKGLDIPELIDYYNHNRTLEGFGDCEFVSNEELLELPVIALIPAALDGVVNEKNASKIKAKIIAEGANGPVTRRADEILDSLGVMVIPDILANGGGVIVSYFEWVQGIASYFWEESEVNMKLRKVITSAFEKVWNYSQDKNFNMRNSAMAVSAKRLEAAMLLRGLYPR